MKIVVVGPGVFGSIYGGLLARSGHDVTLIARGQRLADLRAYGLVLEDADSGQCTENSLPVLDELSPHDRYDLVPVPVRSERADWSPVSDPDCPNRPGHGHFSNACWTGAVGSIPPDCSSESTADETGR